MAHLFLLSAPFDESRYTHSLPTFLFINRIYVARMIGVKRVLLETSLDRSSSFGFH